MSEIFSNIGSFLSGNLGKTLLTAVTAGAGLTQNVLAERQAQAKTNYVLDLLNDPKKFQALVAKNEQPLAQGLTQDVTNATNASLAEKGLGSSPAISQQVLAQALAPFYQQQQTAAQQNVLQLLSGYMNSPTPKPVDISSILKMFMTPKAAAPDVTAGINPADVPNPGIDWSAILPNQTNPNLGDFSTLPPPMIGGDTTLPTAA